MTVKTSSTPAREFARQRGAGSWWACIPTTGPWLASLTAALLLLAAPLRAEESRWALLVGIDDYIDPSISSLSGSVNDVEAIRDTLVTRAEFPSSQVFLLTSNDPGNLPTRGNIRARLAHIARNSDSDDLVYLHFSLHAVLDDETGEGVLLTHRTDPRYTAEEGLTLTELSERMGALAASKRMLVLDGCRNDPELARGERDNRLDERFSRGLVLKPAAPSANISFTQTLFACSPGERAYEWPGRDRGLFSVALEEGLRGAADGTRGDGRVTLGEVCAYVQTRVPKLLSIHLPGKQQHPDIAQPSEAARGYELSEAQPGGGVVFEDELPPVARQAVTATADLDPVFVRKVARPPSIKLTRAPTQPLTRSQARALLLRWEADVDRGAEGYRWRLDDHEPKQTRRDWADISAPEPGTHTFQVQVQDHWGNWSAPAKVAFEVLPNRRPEVAFVSPLDGARVGSGRLAVELRGEDPDGRIVRWRLALDDPDDFEQRAEARFDLPAPVDGPHTLFAQAVDDEGAASLWQTRAFYFRYTEPERAQLASRTTSEAGGEAAGEAAGGAAGRAPSQVPGQAAGQIPGQAAGQVPGQAAGQTHGQAPGETAAAPSRDVGGATASGAAPSDDASAAALSWTRGRPAPQLDGFTSAGGNVQGYPEYVKDLGDGVGMRFVLLPAGSFRMGSPAHEEGRASREGPQHQVMLDAFLIAKTECSQRQWQAVMGSNPAKFTGSGRDAPVEQVSWNDIQAFERETGLCLPSEAQWEYATRAGSTGARHGALPTVAWFDQNSRSKTHTAGTQTANAFGLHDVLGNVSEWCEDTWHKDYTEAPDDGAAWLTSSSSYRVLRGGCWADPSKSCRSAQRSRSGAGIRHRQIGFRPVASLR